MSKLKLAIIGHEFNMICLNEIIKNSEMEISKINIEKWNSITKSERKELIRKYDFIHFLWGQRNVNEFLFAKIKNTKFINHYIGTDVLQLLNSGNSTKRRAYICSLFAYRTLSVSENLSKELNSIKIKDQILPLNFREIPLKFPELPQKPAVYTYLPQHRIQFYGWKLLERLIIDFPDVTFYILAHDGSYLPEYGNVQFVGWTNNIESYIEKSIIHLRLTQHDGLPKTILEALANGRQVIYTQKFPHCYFAQNYEEVKKSFQEIINKPELNYPGAVYIKENFNPELIRQKLLNLYLNV